MKNLKRVVIFSVLILVILAVGCEKKKEITLGELKDNVYTNDYFGMKVSIPEGWTLLDQETMKELVKEGNEVIAGDDESKAKQLELAEEKVLNFFMAFKYPMTVQTFINPNVICNAEKVSLLQGVKSGEDYISIVKKSLEEVKEIPYEFEEISTEKLGGKDFYSMNIKLVTPDITVHQKYFSRVEEGYALNFIFTYADEEGEEEIKNTINSIEFE